MWSAKAKNKKEAPPQEESGADRRRLSLPAFSYRRA
jgi:hypothetical protein